MTTGRLGASGSQLGKIVLGDVGTSGSGIDPDQFGDSNLVITQSAVANYSLQKSASSTFVISQSVSQIYGIQGEIYILSGTTFIAPLDWPGIADIVECIGGGAGGRRPDVNSAVGGGGGAYSRQDNVTVSNGAQLQIGAGGAANTDGGDTWFNGASLAASSCGAKGGTAGSSGVAGVGGAAASGVGTTKYSGGNGGGKGGNQQAGAGGGGAAGPNGNGGNGGDGGTLSAGAGGGGNGGGGNGTSAVGGVSGVGGTSWNGTLGGTGSAVMVPTDGSQGSGGGGGSAPRGTAGAGGDGNEWQDTPYPLRGSGGGGGGSDINNNGSSGGAGGLFGGGGGGESSPHGFGTVPGDGGQGAQGIIRIVYTPIGGSHNADNTIVFSQDADCEIIYYTSSTLTFSQTATAERLSPTSNTITFSQSASALRINPASNTLALSHNVVAGFIYTRSVDSTLTFTQTATGFVPNQRASQTLAMTSSVDVDTVLERSSSHTLVFSQLSEAVQLRTASSEITFTDEALVDVGKGASNTFVMTQDLTVNLTPHNDTAHNTLTFVGTVDPDAVFNRIVSQTLTINQAVDKQIVKEASASNLFVMASQSQGFKVLRASNTIVFSNTSVIHKVISLSVASTLNLQQTLARTATYNLALTSPLVFQHLYQKPTMIGGIFSYTPVPEVIITKVIDRVSFRTKDRAIILRPPLLGDGEAGTGKIVLQRTITGGTYVYARRTSTRKLKYTFETDSFKAFEMRRFMLDCLSEPIWLENWKGEIWVGYFMSNPFAITTRGIAAPCGNWHSFDIEFEGERIH